MPDLATQIGTLRRQQAAIARFGGFALRQHDLLTVLTEAARACADGLSVSFCKVCRYRPEENDLLIEAGFGWQEGVIGHIVSRADESSPQGRAFITGKPVICNDLREDGRFDLPPFYAEHGIVSTIDVLIKGEGQPYGVLEIDNDRQTDYNKHDVDFLTGFANVLAEAVATSVRMAALKAAIDEKNRLLNQKKILAEELQHRVRNNLQLVYGMLRKQADEMQDEVGRRGIVSIARRVSTLAQVHDNLLGTEIARTTDFGTYVNSLCLNIAEIRGAKIGLTCDYESILLDLDTVTALGIVLAELVANSYDHAFPNGEGSIAVALRGPEKNRDGIATLMVSDTGIGFTPEYKSKRHGLGLVRRLIEQVRGTVEVRTDHGAVWEIRFPVPSMTSLVNDPARSSPSRANSPPRITNSAA